MPAFPCPATAAGSATRCAGSRSPRTSKRSPTIGEEADPAAGGLERATRRADLGRGARAVPQRRPSRAARSACAATATSCSTAPIGHARGNGPDDGRETPKVPATTDTPFCVFSTSKAITALVVHLLQEHGALDIADRVADYIPEYAAHGKDDTTIAHVLAHRAGVPRLPEEVLDLDRVGDREFLIQAICEAKPFVKPGTLLAYHADLRRLHPRRDRPARDRQDDPRGPGRGDPRPAGLPLGQLRRRAARTSTRSRLNYVTGRRCCPALDPGHAGAEPADRQGRRALERPALPDRRDPQPPT